MFLVVKLLLVAIGLVSQDRILPDQEPPVSEMDTLVLPDDHPEWALARRAMASEGLCHPGHDAGESPSPAAHPAVLSGTPVEEYSIVRLVAEACE